MIRTYAPNAIHDLNAPRENYDLDIPAGILLSSPLVSGETDSISWKRYEKTDMVSRTLAEMVFKDFLGLPETSPDDLPLLKLGKIKHDFVRFCPKHALVFVGSKECLRDHVVELASAVDRDGGVDIRLITEDYAHDWFMIHEVIPKKDKHIIDYYDELFVDFAMDAVQAGLENHCQIQKRNSSAENELTGEKQAANGSSRNDKVSDEESVIHGNSHLENSASLVSSSETSGNSNDDSGLA